MSLNISSEKIDNPLLVELLRQLNRTFSKIGSDFFVIGATARDIILSVLANTSAKRKTKDLDITIALTGWDKYNEICQALIACVILGAKFGYSSIPKYNIENLNNLS